MFAVLLAPARETFYGKRPSFATLMVAVRKIGSKGSSTRFARKLHHTLPAGLPLCHMALYAMGHIHPPYKRVRCDLRVKGADHGKETTMTSPVGEKTAVSPFHIDVPEEDLGKRIS